MASSRDEKRVDFVATDNVSKVAEQAADAIEAIPDTSTTELTADDHITPELAGIRARLQGLSGEEVRVVLEARADQLQRELAKSLVALRNVEAFDGEEITLRVDARDQAKAKLDAVQAELRALDGESANVNVDAPNLDGLLDKLGSLPGALGDVAGSLGSAGLAGAAGAVAAGLFAAADSAANMAVEAQTTADLTGSTVEDASRLQAVWSSTGADVNDLNDVLLQMNGVLQQNPGLAKQLGINLNDGKDIAGRFVEVVDRVSRSTGNAADRAQLMANLFGEEGVRQVGKLTTLIGGSLQDAVANVADTAIISDADVANAVKFKAQMAEVKTAVQGAATEIGQSLVPAIAGLAEAGTAPIGKTSVLGLLANPPPLQWINQVTGGLSAWSNRNAATAGETKALTDAITAAATATAVQGDNTLSTAVALGEYANAQAIVTALADVGTAAMEESAKATQANADALNAAVTAYQGAADATIAASDAQAAFAEAAKASNETQKDGKATTDDKADAVRAERDALINAANAESRRTEETAKANGTTATATSKLDAFNDSLLQNATFATPAARAAIADYIIEVNGIPPEKATDIRAAIVAGDLATADRLLDEASVARDVALEADAETAEAKRQLDKAAEDRDSTITANVAKGSGWDIFRNPFGRSAPGADVGWGGGGLRTVPAAMAAEVPGSHLAFGLPSSGGTPTANLTVNVNANGAMLGDRFAVERAVRKAVKDGVRLAGARP